MKKFEVVVTQHVTVEVDETRFTEEWMAEFRESFYDFYTIEDHVEHLAGGHARGLWDNFSFIEGYGPAYYPSNGYEPFGINFFVNYVETEVECVETEVE